MNRMKSLVLGLSLLGLASVAQAGGVVGLGADTEREVIVPDRIFAPTGFDDNDNVQVMVAGNLPNTCYKVGEITREVSPETRTVTIRHDAIFHPKSWCLFTMVPYREVLNVGVLGAGPWKFVFADGSGKARDAGSINVSVSPSSAPDSFLYALVDDVQVQRGQAANASSGSTLVVSVSMLNSCMKMKELRVIRNDPSVLEVLPIVEMEDRQDCAEALIPFDATAILDPSIKGEVLIHVRSLNGQAFNKMIKL